MAGDLVSNIPMQILTMERLKVAKFYFTHAMQSQIKPEPVSMLPRKVWIKSKGDSDDLSDQGQKTLNVWAKSGPPLICTNKVLLEHNYTHSFMYCFWLLSPYKSRTEQFRKRLYGPRAEHIQSLALYRKRWLMLVQDDQRRPHTTRHCSRDHDTVLFPNKVHHFWLFTYVNYSESRLRQNNCTYSFPTFLFCI